MKVSSLLLCRMNWLMVYWVCLDNCLGCISINIEMLVGIFVEVSFRVWMLNCW